MVGFVGDKGVFAVLGHGFGLGMFECADAAFLIGGYPSSQVGSENAVVVCGTLLAAYMQVVEYGLVFEVSCIFAHKKTAPCELEGMCPTFGVQFRLLYLIYFVWVNCLLPIEFFLFRWFLLSAN